MCLLSSLFFCLYKHTSPTPVVLAHIACSVEYIQLLFNSCGTTSLSCHGDAHTILILPLCINAYMIFDCSLHIRAIHLAFFHACTIIYRVAILSVVLWFFYWHFPSALIPYCIGCLGVWVLHCVITKMTTTYLHRHIMRHNDGYYVLVMANFQRLLIVCSCEHPFFLWISLKIARSLAAKNLRIDNSFVRKHNSPSRAAVSYSTETLNTCGGFIILDTSHVFSPPTHHGKTEICTSTNHVISTNWRAPVPKLDFNERKCINNKCRLAVLLEHWTDTRFKYYVCTFPFLWA